MSCGFRVLWKYLVAFEKVILCMLGIAFTVAAEERRQSPPSALYFVSSVYNSHDVQARDSERGTYTSVTWENRSTVLQ
jgi:hypothetical protein